MCCQLAEHSACKKIPGQCQLSLQFETYESRESEDFEGWSITRSSFFITFQVVAGVTTAESSSDPPGESLKSGGDSGDPPVELRKGKRCRVLFSYRPTHEDELELNPNELIDFICEVSKSASKKLKYNLAKVKNSVNFAFKTQSTAGLSLLLNWKKKLLMRKKLAFLPKKLTFFPSKLNVPQGTGLSWPSEKWTKK